MLVSPYYPYPPRPGHRPEGMSYDIGELAAPTLSADARDEVVRFEHALYGVGLDAAQFTHAGGFAKAQQEAGTPVAPLEAVWRRKVNSRMLGVDYFRTRRGRAALRDVTGVQLRSSSYEETAARLYGLDIEGVDTKVLDTLQAASIGHEEGRLTRLFLKGGHRGAAVPDPHIITVYKDPDIIVQKMRGLGVYREYLRHTLYDLQATAQADPAVVAVEAFITTLYRRKVNNMKALLYVDALRLMHQSRQGGGRHAEQVASLQAMLPLLSYVGGRSDTAGGFLERMDRYRFGVSADENGSFTWCSPEALALAARAEQVRPESAAVDRGIYGDVDPGLLETTTISGDTFGTWLSDALTTYGWLSSHTEWSEEREGPAPDGNWQVIVHEKFKSLAVNDKQRIMKVPKKDISILKAVSVGDHEITHVIQHQNKRALGRLAILERIGFDTASEQTESGGVWREQRARGMLTGTYAPEIAGTGYLKALSVKAEGGTYGDAVEAYYYDLLRRNPNLSSEAAAAQAVNRARRIYRSGGWEFAARSRILTNTQTLSYLEQHAVYAVLPEAERKMLLVGGVTVANLVQLAAYGLVNPDNITFPEKTPCELMYPHVKRAIGA